MHFARGTVTIIYFYQFLLALLYYKVERCRGQTYMKSLQVTGEDFAGYILFLIIYKVKK